MNAINAYRTFIPVNKDRKTCRSLFHCKAITPSMHESISYGRYFKELLQTKLATVQSMCITNLKISFGYYLSNKISLTTKSIPKWQ